MAATLNWAGIIYEFHTTDARSMRTGCRHSGVDALWPALAQLDDVSALIARILLSELGQDTLDFPLLQTKIISSTMLLEFSPVQDASARSLRPELFLPEKLETLRKVRLNGAAIFPNREPTPDGRPLIAGESTLLDIIEIREWRRWQNSPTPKAWMMRPGQWAYWGLTNFQRVALGQAFSASLTFGNRATAELTLALGQLIGLTILCESQALQTIIRLQSLLAAVDKIPAPAKTVNTTVQSTYRQCFEALIALESVGLISDLVLPSPELQQRAKTPSHWHNLTIALGGPTGAA